MNGVEFRRNADWTIELIHPVQLPGAEPGGWAKEVGGWVVDGVVSGVAGAAGSAAYNTGKGRDRTSPLVFYRSPRSQVRREMLAWLEDCDAAVGRPVPSRRTSRLLLLSAVGGTCLLGAIAAAAGYFSRPHDSTPTTVAVVAFVFAAFPGFLASYCLGLLFVPRSFFDTTAGKRLLQFVGATSPRAARIAATVGVVLCAALTGFIIYLAARAFKLS